jgi:hypothetical protein
VASSHALMEGRHSPGVELLDLNSRAERRKAQNRTNQRAARRRKAIRAAGDQPVGEQGTIRDEYPETFRILHAITPGASDNSDVRDEFDLAQSRALSATLASSSHLDQAKVLVPLLADPHLRKVWSTGTYLMQYYFETGQQHLTGIDSCKRSMATPRIYQPTRWPEA